MTASLPFYAAADIHRVLDYVSLVEALRRAFSQGADAPVRYSHAVGPADSGNVLLLMPAWRAGEAIGVKIVTDVDKSGFIAVADPYLDKLAKELGPHAEKIKNLIRAIN